MKVGDIVAQAGFSRGNIYHMIIIEKSARGYDLVIRIEEGPEKGNEPRRWFAGPGLDDVIPNVKYRDYPGLSDQTKTDLLIQARSRAKAQGLPFDDR